MRGKASFEKIEKFLFHEEINTSYITHASSTMSPLAIKITNGNFFWTKNESKLTNDKKMENSRLILKNINLRIKKRSFVAIIGE